jgi:hypothetical protein
LILKYAHVFCINPEEWKSKNGSDDEKFVVAREEELPPEVAQEAEEVESYVVDGETGLKYKPTLKDFGRMGGKPRYN